MPAMTEDRFRTPPQIHSRQFERELIVLHLGAGKYFSLDEVAAEIWTQLMAGKTVAEVLAQLLETYEIDEHVARADVERLAKELLAADLLEHEG